MISHRDGKEVVVCDGCHELIHSIAPIGEVHVHIHSTACWDRHVARNVTYREADDEV